MLCRETKPGRVENSAVKHLTLILFIRLTFPILFVFDSECPDQPHVPDLDLQQCLTSLVIAAIMEFPWDNRPEIISFDVGE